MVAAGMIIFVVAGWSHVRFRTAATEVFFWIGYAAGIGILLYSFFRLVRLPPLRKSPQSWKQQLLTWQSAFLVALALLLAVGVPIVEHYWGSDAKFDFSAVLTIVIFCWIAFVLNREVRLRSLGESAQAK
jgi:hypothetical protein